MCSYVNKGVTLLFVEKFRMTSGQETKLSTWLEDRFCRSAGEIRAFITTKFELGYYHSCCLKMLGRLGFEYRKPKALPRVANEDKQAEFIAFYQDFMTKLSGSDYGLGNAQGSIVAII